LVEISNALSRFFFSILLHRDFLGCFMGWLVRMQRILQIWGQFHRVRLLNA
jgi:hypothetical protein